MGYIKIEEKDSKGHVITSQSAIKEADGRRARLIGTHSGTGTANTTTNVDWEIPQLEYPAATDSPSIFDGIQYFAENSKIGDSLNFQVVDKTGAGVALGLYTQAAYDAYKDVDGVMLVEQFGDSWFIAPNTLSDIVLYKARLLPGLHVRVQYINTSAATDVSFFCNLFRHLDPSV